MAAYYPKLKIDVSEYGTKALTCPWCGYHTDSIKIAEFHEEYVSCSYKSLFKICQCTNCFRPIIHDWIKDSTIPYRCEFDDIPNMPDNDISKLYKEVRDAHSIGAYTCSVTTCRTLLSHIAVEEGAEEGLNFVKYVRYIEETCLPPCMKKEWLDDIRKSGNECIHELKIADEKLSSDMIKLISIVLRSIYDIPESNSKIEKNVNEKIKQSE